MTPSYEPIGRADPSSEVCKWILFEKEGKTEQAQEEELDRAVAVDTVVAYILPAGDKGEC